MTMYNVYEAKTQLSKLLDMVASGQEVVIAKNGKPLVDLKPHVPKKKSVQFGTMANQLKYEDGDFVGMDPAIQVLFYGNKNS